MSRLRKAGTGPGRKAWLVPAAIAVCIALIAAACGFFAGDDALNPMTLKPEAGRVFIVRNGESIPVTETVPIQAHDIVRTGRSGLARFALQGDRRVLVGKSTAVRIVDGGEVEAQRGSMLAQSGSDATKVLFGAVTAKSSDSWFRVDVREGNYRAATYKGRTDLMVPGESRLQLTSLYETLVVGSDLRQAVPYTLNPRDAWDRQVLGQLIDLDRQLTQLAEGLSLQLGKSRPDVSYFSGLMQGRSARFVKPYLKDRPVVDLLIGFTIATQADADPGDALDQAFALRDDKAPPTRWGVVVGIMDVPPGDLVAQLEATVNAIPGVASGEDGDEVDFDAALGDESSAVVDEDGNVIIDDDGGTGVEPPTGGGDPPREPEPPPPTDPPPTDDPDPECTDVVECAVNDAQNEVPTPGPTPTGFPLID